MRILHTADWHIGRILNEYSLIEDQAYILNHLVSYVCERHIDALVVAGDIYDRSIPSAEAVSLLDHFLNKIISLQIPVLMIAGNHDSPTRLSFCNKLYEKSRLYIEGDTQAQIRKVTLQDEYGPVNFFLLPYFTPADARRVFQKEDIRTYDEAFQAFMEYNQPYINWEERNVLVAHGFFSWIQEEKAVDAVFSDSEISLGGSDIIHIQPGAGFDYIALGHLHAPQRVGKEAFRYAGSLLKYSVSEAVQKKGFSLVELCEKGRVEISRAALEPLRDLRVVKGGCAGILDANQYNGTANDDYVFVNLTDDGAVLDAMARLKEVFPHLLGLRFVNREEEGTEEWKDAEARMEKSASPLDMFCEFYQAVRGEPIPEGRRILVQSVIEELAEDREVQLV